MRGALACLFLASVTNAFAGSGIDERVGKDEGGIYRAQHAVPVVLGLAAAGCALTRGAADRLGRSCWRSGEAALSSYATAKALQWAIDRESPANSADPDDFSANSSGSFPSGHVAFTTALVTPIVLEYVQERPAVALLLLFPVYEAVARVKARDHWQTDVLGGLLLGGAIGALEVAYDGPVTLRLLPGGAALEVAAHF